jgi:RND family efflux transporter MFP subunit
VVKLKLLDEADFVHEGQMTFIDNAISRTSGTIRGRAEFVNPKGLFTPGLFGRIRIEVDEPADALLIPEAAIGSEQVRKLVMVLGDGDVVQPKYVQLGSTVDGLRVVESGLTAGDRVVIDGLMRVRPGVKVSPKAGTIAAAAPLPARAN